MTDPQLASDLSLMESISKFFAVLLGILYLLGFLVVAIHLSKYGVSSFSVLQLQYLIAGLWLLGLPVLFGCAVVASRVFEERLTPDVEGQFNWRRFLINGSFGGAITVLFIILLLSIPNLADDLTLGIILGVLLFEVVIMNLVQMFWISWRQSTSSKNTWLLNRSAAAPFYLVVLVIVVLLYATWFSKHLYPLIPFSLGGGKPLTIVFIEGEKKMPDEIKRSAPSAKRSIPYKLLLSTDNSYIVDSQSPIEKSLEIRRDAVAGIIVLQ